MNVPRTTPWAYWMTNLPNSKHQFSGAMFVLARYFLYVPYLLQVGWNHRPEKNHHLPFALKLSCLGRYIWALFWSNESDLTRPQPKLWLSKGHPLISGKSRLVKYYKSARLLCMLHVHVLLYCHIWRTTWSIPLIIPNNTLPCWSQFFLVFFQGKRNTLEAGRTIGIYAGSLSEAWIWTLGCSPMSWFYESFFRGVRWFWSHGFFPIFKSCFIFNFD